MPLTKAPSAVFQSLISPLRLECPPPEASSFPSGEKASAVTMSTGGPSAMSSSVGGVCSPPIVRSRLHTLAAFQIPARAGPPATSICFALGASISVRPSPMPSMIP